MEENEVAIRVTSTPSRDPESGGPALTAGKVYLGKLRTGESGWVLVRDDEGYPYLLEPERFEIVEGER